MQERATPTSIHHLLDASYHRTHSFPQPALQPEQTSPRFLDKDPTKNLLDNLEEHLKKILENPPSERLKSSLQRAEIVVQVKRLESSPNLSLNDTFRLQHIKNTLAHLPKHSTTKNDENSRNAKNTKQGPDRLI